MEHYHYYYANDPLLNQQHALYVFSPKPCNILYLVCKMYLENGRHSWRHGSVRRSCHFLSPFVITGNFFGPYFILLTNDNILYFLELNIGFETNIKANGDRKALKYYPLRKPLLSKYNQVKFVSLPLRAVGTIGVFL